MEGLEGLVLGLQGLEDVARLLVSNARLFKSNRAKTCLDSSAVAFLDSSVGVFLDSSAASGVSQSAGARCAPSCKGQRRGLSRLAVRPVFYISMRQSRIQSSELSAKNKHTLSPLCICVLIFYSSDSISKMMQRWRPTVVLANISQCLPV